LEGVEPPIHLDMKRRVGRSKEQELAVEFSELYFFLLIFKDNSM
jgi:hypothetical protein